MPTISRREHLVETAVELFAAQGYHATGIDQIIARAGVSKKTLYHHFRSKEELILAALRHYDGLFRNGFMRQVEAAATSPRQRLLAVFDVAGQWFAGEAFYGCMFINAVGEYAEDDTPIRAVCRDFKRLMRGYLLELCQAAGAADPRTLADQLALILEGAIVTAQVSERTQAARIARNIASLLIERAVPAEAPPPSAVAPAGG